MGIPKEFLERDTLQLARYIIAEIDTPLQLAVSMGLNEAQWAVLKDHPHFHRCMTEARAEANSASGLVDRVRLKAMVAIDSGGILDMAQIAGNPALAATARVAAYNALVDTAGLAKTKDAQASQAGAGPLVTINMPSRDGAPVRITVPATIEG